MSLLLPQLSRVVAVGLCIAVASCCRAWVLGCMGSVAVAHRLGCSSACGIFLSTLEPRLCNKESHRSEGLPHCDYRAAPTCHD